MAKRLVGLTRFVVIVSIWSCTEKTSAPATADVDQRRDPTFTTASGPQYVSECVAAGVPIPPDVLGPNWTNLGVVDQPFEAPGLEAELWAWTSQSPQGICLALPRWTTASPTAPSEAAPLGVICFGTAADKACFFDSANNTPAGTYLRSNTAGFPFSSLLGGLDLNFNAQGVCTDCHAGQNPFVVHPEKQAFSQLRNAPYDQLMKNTWYEPITSQGWPHNPGPTQRLGQPTLAGVTCIGCHPLPEVSTALEGYCTLILDKTVTRASETMPPTYSIGALTLADSRIQYSKHINDLLLDYCKRPVSVEEPVFADEADDILVLSPPSIIEPLHACARTVAISGVVPEATVLLFRNGSATPEVQGIAEASDVVVLPLASALKDGDVLTARQELGASFSEDVTATANKFVGSIPTPIVSPDLIYRCATQVGVSALPGALVRVTRTTANGAISVSTRYFAQTNDSIIFPNAFGAGDSFTATASLCSDESSASIPAIAVEPPPSLRPPRFDPPTPYEGQVYAVNTGLDNGAFSELWFQGNPTPYFLGFTEGWPDSSPRVLHLPSTQYGQPLSVGAQLEATSRLFCNWLPGSTATSAPALPCSQLPPPRAPIRFSLQESRSLARRIDADA